MAAVREWQSRRRWLVFGVIGIAQLWVVLLYRLLVELETLGLKLLELGAAESSVEIGQPIVVSDLVVHVFQGVVLGLRCQVFRSERP